MGRSNYHFVLGVCAALFTSTQADAAQWRGEMAVGAWANEDVQSTFVFGDFDINGSVGPVGYTLGMFGMVGRLHETYAALTWDYADGVLAFGFPRPAYDGFAQSAFVDVAPRQGLETIGYSRSQATWGTMFQSDFLPYGATYTAADVAVSLHGVPDTDVVILGAGKRMTRGAVRYDMAGEVVAIGGDIKVNVKAQAIVKFHEFDFSAGYFHADANGMPDLLELSVGHGLGSTDVTAVYRHDADGMDQFGLGMTRRLSGTYDAEFGVAFGDAGRAASLAIVRRF